MKKLLLVFAVLTMLGCTEKQRAKSWGGDMTIDLPKGERLIEATWKNEDLWYLTRPRTEGETPTTYKFREDSSFGVMEGTVTFKEQ